MEDAVEDPIDSIKRDEVVQALNEMKTGKAPGSSEIYIISVELALSIVIPIFKAKGDIRNCSCYRAMKLLEHGMKVC